MVRERPEDFQRFAEDSVPATARISKLTLLTDELSCLLRRLIAEPLGYLILLQLMVLLTLVLRSAARDMLGRLTATLGHRG